ncbi:MAG: 50S ribosomal protein L15 [Candidatus Diapherotrites archaeon]|nr:50S ribosomal protein L15 [Candidatus Diapherotrites archaeon]
MVITKRKSKKITKMRGRRTMGIGNTKNNRGGGCKGGRGRAGSNKHKFSKYYKTLGMAPGFKRPNVKGSTVMNVELMTELVISKSLGTIEGNHIVVDLTKAGYTKLLGKGIAYKTEKPLKIIVDSVSASVTELAEKNKWELVASGANR